MAGGGTGAKGASFGNPKGLFFRRDFARFVNLLGWIYTLFVLMARKVGVLSVKRRARLAMEVAPLVAQGVNMKGVAEKLGVSLSTASHDIAAVKQIWAEELKADINEVRGKAVAEYDWLAQQAIEGWKASVAEGKRSDRFLNAAANCLEKRNKLLGLGLDVNLVQNNLNLHGEASAAEVSQVFAPMDPSDYDAFISQRGAMTVLPPVPEEDTPDNPEIQRGSGENDWGVSPN